MAQEEHVLVVDRKVLEQVGMFQGLTLNTARYLHKLFAPGILNFLPRSQAEANPSYKQLIPYVIMSYDGRYLTYVRGKRAGETRLLGLRSIGIGGHINPIDADNSSLFAYLYENYLTAVQREVAEEVSVEANHTDTIVALLNDDSNEVGSVHLGIVHHWILDAPKVTRREQMITRMAFMTPAELQKVRDSMETWSQLCFDNLDEMTKKTEESFP